MKLFFSFGTLFSIRDLDKTFPISKALQVEEAFKKIYLIHKYKKL